MKTECWRNDWRIFKNWNEIHKQDSPLGQPRSENANISRVSVAISYSDSLHGKLHHAAKFQTAIWFP